ncbi:hypothetical protein glysoja_037691 [Glycine soja]|uniref:Uncharacterized protein n=1 Tax=Glycine soja TaxID=3848 RepID=A0A0B2RE65_GLYSO|nr:hypothetical protein glysoja_037691 [Glycine soja]
MDYGSGQRRVEIVSGKSYGCSQSYMAAIPSEVTRASHSGAATAASLGVLVAQSQGGERGLPSIRFTRLRERLRLRSGMGSDGSNIRVLGSSMDTSVGLCLWPKLLTRHYKSSFFPSSSFFFNLGLFSVVIYALGLIVRFACIKGHP